MKTKISITILAFFYVGITYLNAQILGQDETSNPIVTAVPFLTIAPDARSASLGDIGVATSPDIYSTHWNPAKLAFAEDELNIGASFTPWHRKLASDMFLAYISAYTKISEKEAVSFSFKFFELGEAMWNSATDLSLYEYSIDAAYSRKLSEKLSMAVSLRFFNTKISGLFGSNRLIQSSDLTPKSSVAGDISLFYKSNNFKIAGMDSRLAWGVNISNIGPKIKYSNSSNEDFLPTNLRIGAALISEISENHKLTWALDFNKLLVPTNATRDISSTDDSAFSGIFKSFTDAPGGFSDEMKEINIGTGLEYWYKEFIALRSGYFTENRDKGNRQYVTLGLGTKFNSLSLDLAMVIPQQDGNPLEDTFRVNLIFNLK